MLRARHLLVWLGTRVLIFPIGGSASKLYPHLAPMDVARETRIRGAGARSAPRHKPGNHEPDHFFWDTDFLAAGHLLGLTTQHRQQVGLSDEAWSMAAGLKPHPDELAIQVWEDEAGWDAESVEYPASGIISSYPRE